MTVTPLRIMRVVDINLHSLAKHFSDEEAAWECERPDLVVM